MSVIKFKDFDKAYEQTEKIYKLIQNEGNTIVKNIDKICLTLKDKWKSQDAPIHINNLIAIQNNLKKYFIVSTNMIVEVSNRVIDIQEAIHSINGVGTVGDLLKDDFEGTKDGEEEIEKKSYIVESLIEEYNLLDETCTIFNTFKNQYSLFFEEFFDNWKDDPKKLKIEEKFNEFIALLDSYQKVLEETRQALGMVATNAEQILEN